MESHIFQGAFFNRLRISLDPNFSNQQFKSSKSLCEGGKNTYLFSTEFEPFASENKIKRAFCLIEPSSGDVLNKHGRVWFGFLMWLSLKIGKRVWFGIYCS